MAESFASCLKTINVEVVSLRAGSLHTGTNGELWTTRDFSAREWFDKTLQEFSQLTPPTSLVWNCLMFQKIYDISRHIQYLTVQVLSTVGFMCYKKEF